MKGKERESSASGQREEVAERVVAGLLKGRCASPGVGTESRSSQGCGGSIVSQLGRQRQPSK